MHPGLSPVAYLMLIMISCHLCLQPLRSTGKHAALHTKSLIVTMKLCNGTTIVGRHVGLSRMYLHHHELESVIIIIIMLAVLAWWCLLSQTWNICPM